MKSTPKPPPESYFIIRRIRNKRKEIERANRELASLQDQLSKNLLPSSKNLNFCI